MEKGWIEILNYIFLTDAENELTFLENKLPAFFWCFRSEKRFKRMNPKLISWKGPILICLQDTVIKKNFLVNKGINFIVKKINANICIHVYYP